MDFQFYQIIQREKTEKMSPFIEFITNVFKDKMNSADNISLILCIANFLERIRWKILDFSGKN
jgi:hypothetical protein